MRRPHSVVAATLAVGLLAACGTQVNSATRRQLESAQLSGSSESNGAPAGTAAGSLPITGPSQPGAGPSIPTGTTGMTATGTTTTGGTTTNGAGTTKTGGKTSTTAGTTTANGLPAGVGAPAPAGGNGGATDVGVTATQILLGNVSDLSGPQPGLFQSAINGTNAYIAYINSLGGIYGRQLKIDVADSQTSCEGDRNGIEEEVGKVFAFAGSFALNDECGATVLATHKTVPDAHLAVTPQANSLPNNYSVTPIGTKISNGPFKWVTDKWGLGVVQHTGFLYANLPAVNNVAALSIHSAETVGWKFVVHQSVSPTSTDFTAQIIQMRQAGVKLFYTLFDAQELAEFMRNANQQNFHPVIFAPLAYDQTFFTDLGSPALGNGIYGFNGATMFFSAGDIANIPATGLFHKWYSLVSHNGPADSFGADAWSETELLVDAIAAAGPDLTREKVLAALSKIHHFDANGFFAPADPADKLAGNCFVPWVIKDGQYVRTGVSATAFLCQGTPE